MNKPLDLGLRKSVYQPVIFPHWKPCILERLPHGLLSYPEILTIWMFSELTGTEL